MNRRMLMLAGSSALVGMCVRGQDAAAALSPDAARFLQELGYGSDLGRLTNAYPVPAGGSPKCDPLTDSDVAAFFNGPPSVAWPTLEKNAPDYTHLPDLSCSNAFSLSAAALRDICSANNLSLREEERYTVVGIRGCVLASKADTALYATAHAVECVAPDHLSFKCLIGVWDRKEDTLALFSGSTVPGAIYMRVYARTWCFEECSRTSRFGASCRKRCNMMLTGLYNYKVGIHRQDTPDAQFGALTETGQQCIMRTIGKLSYDSTLSSSTLFESDSVGNNIHAAQSDSSIGKSSAGCQVIKGHYSKKSGASGAWQQFRIALGLPDPPPITMQAYQNVPKFQYLLVTGREAACAAAKGDAYVAKRSLVRPGSTGPEVENLQKLLSKASVAKKALAFRQGVFDGATFNAVMDFQNRKGISPQSAVVDLQAFKNV